MSALNYHIVPKNFPNDILNYVINGYIADLFFLDQKKTKPVTSPTKLFKNINFDFTNNSSLQKNHSTMPKITKIPPKKRKIMVHKEKEVTTFVQITSMQWIRIAMLLKTGTLLLRSTRM